MRSGFKNMTGGVTGVGETKKAKSSLLGTIVTVVLVLATAAILWRRFGR
jgi:hypothetical protein